MTDAQQLFFTSSSQVEVRSIPVPEPGAGQLLVKTSLSAISPGSELLIYRGQLPSDLAVDEAIASLAGQTGFPMQYGYCAAGKVIDFGTGVDPAWTGRQVFSFQPHASHFLARPEEVQIVPDDLTINDAVFLPNMETAVNLVQDGAPRLGENVIVLGQGIVGLLTTALLQRFPLNQLISIDRFAKRRQASLELGVQTSLDPGDPDTIRLIRSLLPEGADLVFEISGAPAALDSAIAFTGFAGRVIIGSWYGQKRASLNLGGHFHRSRIQLISSQVSTLAPELSGRWNKQRRFETAWEMLRQVRPSRWVTHEFSLNQAPEAYQLLDQNPEQAIQVVFRYQP